MSSPTEAFIPAENLINTVDLEGWDSLIGRGTQAEGPNKWQRESLFLKFDPMIAKQSPIRGGPAEKSVPLGDVSNFKRYLGGSEQLVCVEEATEEAPLSPVKAIHSEKLSTCSKDEPEQLTATVENTKPCSVSPIKPTDQEKITTNNNGNEAILVSEVEELPADASDNASSDLQEQEPLKANDDEELADLIGKISLTEGSFISQEVECPPLEKIDEAEAAPNEVTDHLNSTEEDVNGVSDSPLSPNVSQGSIQEEEFYDCYEESSKDTNAVSIQVEQHCTNELSATSSLIAEETSVCQVKPDLGEETIQEKEINENKLEEILGREDCWIELDKEEEAVLNHKSSPEVPQRLSCVEIPAEGLESTTQRELLSSQGKTEDSEVKEISPGVDEEADAVLFQAAEQASVIINPNTVEEVKLRENEVAEVGVAAAQQMMPVEMTEVTSLNCCLSLDGLESGPILLQAGKHSEAQSSLSRSSEIQDVSEMVEMEEKEAEVFQTQQIKSEESIQKNERENITSLKDVENNAVFIETSSCLHELTEESKQTALMQNEDQSTTTTPNKQDLHRESLNDIYTNHFLTGDVLENELLSKVCKEDCNKASNQISELEVPQQLSPVGKMLPAPAQSPAKIIVQEVTEEEQLPRSSFSRVEEDKKSPVQVNEFPIGLTNRNTPGEKSEQCHSLETKAEQLDLSQLVPDSLDATNLVKECVEIVPEVVGENEAVKIDCVESTVDIPSAIGNLEVPKQLQMPVKEEAELLAESTNKSSSPQDTIPEKKMNTSLLINVWETETVQIELEESSNNILNPETSSDLPEKLSPVENKLRSRGVAPAELIGAEKLVQVETVGSRPSEGVINNETTWIDVDKQSKGISNPTSPYENLRQPTPFEVKANEFELPPRNSSLAVKTKEVNANALKEIEDKFLVQIADLQLKLAVVNHEKQAAEEDRDQTLEDLRQVESAFSHVHRKYERTKTALDNLKKNEEIMKIRDVELCQRIEMKDKTIELIKKEAQTSLDTVFYDYELKIQQAESEAQKLRALVRKHEVKIKSLEKDLEQKIKDNEELNALCDDIIKGNS